jgi:hypothetical protein
MLAIIVAYENSKKTVQIRYTLRAIPKAMADAYKNKKPGAAIANPNSYEAEVQAVQLNIAGGGTTKGPQYFPTDAVKSEFGADSGMSFYAENMTSQFGKGFKNVIGVALHRDSLGQAYTFIMYNDKAEYDKVSNDLFYSMKFKK